MLPPLNRSHLSHCSHRRWHQASFHPSPRQRRGWRHSQSRNRRGWRHCCPRTHQRRGWLHSHSRNCHGWHHCCPRPCQSRGWLHSQSHNRRRWRYRCPCGCWPCCCSRCCGYISQTLSPRLNCKLVPCGRHTSAPNRLLPTPLHEARRLLWYGLIGDVDGLRCRYSLQCGRHLQQRNMHIRLRLL